MMVGYGTPDDNRLEKAVSEEHYFRDLAASTSEDVKSLRPDAPNPFDQHPAGSESYLSYKYFKNLEGLEERADRGL
jgi:hypothetical protein